MKSTRGTFLKQGVVGWFDHETRDEAGHTKSRFAGQANSNETEK